MNSYYYIHLTLSLFITYSYTTIAMQTKPQPTMQELEDDDDKDIVLIGFEKASPVSSYPTKNASGQKSKPLRTPETPALTVLDTSIQGDIEASPVLKGTLGTLTSYPQEKDSEHLKPDLELGTLSQRNKEGLSSQDSLSYQNAESPHSATSQVSSIQVSSITESNESSCLCIRLSSFLSCFKKKKT